MENEEPGVRVRVSVSLTKERMGFDAEKVITQKSKKNYHCCYCQHDQELVKCHLLNFMLILYFTDLTRTMLGFFLIEHIVKQTTQADTKNRFKKEKGQAK